MGMIWDVVHAAVRILIHNDYAVYSIAMRSLYVSGTATLLSLVLGVGAGAVLAFRRFPGRLLAITLVNTGMGFPPVVIGLFVALLLWRTGPLGDLGWMYTNKAMITAQVIIATPVITGFTAASLSALDPRLRLQVYALGASRMQMLWILLQEVRLPLLAAVMAGFGAAISEVGASVMVGGNIAGQTRVMTGEVMLETSKGNFDPAMALGFILLGMMIAVNLLFTWVQFGIRRDRSNQRSDNAGVPVIPGVTLSWSAD
ncbi:MAG TPA: ABC transporter permease [Dehalococcoidia bacterium]|jgi:tungstate transport system permease protein|nr:ABC transporter permease [Dehalococcoidia bacterium]